MKPIKITPTVRETLKPGDIVVVDLSPVEGSETDMERPCIVLSAQGLNARSRTVTVVPLTRGAGEIMRLFPKLDPSQNNCGRDGVAVLTQTTSLDLVARDARLIGAITDPSYMQDVKIRLAAIFEITIDTLGG